MAQRAHITITAGGEAVGYLRDASVDTKVSTITAASEDVYGDARRLAASVSWSASGSVFVPLAKDGGQSAILDAMLAREAIAVALDHDGDTDTGTAIITSWDVSGSIGGVVEGSFQLQGVGVLT